MEKNLYGFLLVKIGKALSIKRSHPSALMMQSILCAPFSVQMILKARPFWTLDAGVVCSLSLREN